MKHQDRLSFITDDQAEQMGADMAIQFVLATLFQCVSEMADDPRGFRTDVHRELTESSVKNSQALGRESVFLW